MGSPLWEAPHLTYLLCREGAKLDEGHDGEVKCAPTTVTRQLSRR